jgi:hypothetical protein
MSLLDRMVLAVERVRDRLSRSTNALEAAGIPYAVAGGNAVAAWVATIDAAAVRNTPDVDILIRRSDRIAAAEAFTRFGFFRQDGREMEIFLDGPDGKARDAVHILLAGEMIRPEYLFPAPDIDESEMLETSHMRVLTLEALIRMKLTSFLTKDRVHLQDMLEVGLINAQWTARFPHVLAARLQQLIDTPGQ